MEGKWIDIEFLQMKVSNLFYDSILPWHQNQTNSGIGKRSGKERKGRERKRLKGLKGRVRGRKEKKTKL